MVKPSKSRICQVSSVPFAYEYLAGVKNGVIAGVEWFIVQSAVAASAQLAYNGSTVPMV
jgi:hypothetical protein